MEAPLETLVTMSDIYEARERIAPALFHPRSEASEAARELLHAQEHAADRRAIELLRLTGRNPHAMAGALARIHGGTPAALNLLMGSSHPELRERLARAQAAAICEASLASKPSGATSRGRSRSGRAL